MFHRAQLLVLSPSFSTLHLSPLWLKLILSPTSLLWSYFSPVLLIKYTPLSWPCRHTFLMWRPGQYKTNWNQRWQDRHCYYEFKLENHFSRCSAHFFLCWHRQHSVHRLLATLVSWFQITWLFTNTFQLSAILYMWKSGRSALSASAWLLKQPKLSAVPLFSPS